MTKKPESNDIQVSMNNTPILYTDMVFMNVNEDGVVVDICQKGPGNKHYQVVSRIGMSQEHAQKFVKKLSEILALTHTSKTNLEDKN